MARECIQTGRKVYISQTRADGMASMPQENPDGGQL